MRRAALRQITDSAGPRNELPEFPEAAMTNAKSFGLIFTSWTLEPERKPEVKPQTNPGAAIYTQEV